jgi:CelD/BcsL family acetyltransferase involved in cellulose biosynthesis
MSSAEARDGMRIHDNWATTSFDLEPVASHTGPFPRRDLLRAWWEHCRPDRARLLLADSGDSLLPLVLAGGRLEFLGEPDLTDYHSPLGIDVPAAVATLVAEVPAGTRFQFDSLPREAVDVVAAGLADVGLLVEAEQHDLTTVLDLPDDHDRYLDGLDKKQRHELRRKRRRFESILGEPCLRREQGAEAVATFVEMHRRSDGSKGRFMTAARERLFAALHHDVGAVVDVLAGVDGTPVAAGFGFEDDEGYYLYNSAYEPAAAAASPGIVLVSLLIEDAIGRGRSRFDFLKGDETYKFRLGARPRPLYRVAGVVGGGS